MYLRSLILILFGLLLGLASYAQKKKKSPYADYWAQEEKREQFDQLTKEAYVLFQSGKLQDSKAKYQKALELIPDDQRTIARVRDIDLLIEKRAKQKSSNLDQVELLDSSAKVVSKPSSSESKTEAEPIEIVEENEPEKNLVKNDAVTPKNKVDQSSAKKSASIAKTDITSDNTKPYKNTENYRKYLATIYPEGWTEEEYEEGKKKITKRVIVKGKSGDEYLKVLHHYGATYYFKNGVSISYSTWIAESEKNN